MPVPFNSIPITSLPRHVLKLAYEGPGTGILLLSALVPCRRSVEEYRGPVLLNRPSHPHHKPTSTRPQMAKKRTRDRSSSMPRTRPLEPPIAPPSQACLDTTSNGQEELRTESSSTSSSSPRAGPLQCFGDKRTGGRSSSIPRTRPLEPPISLPSQACLDTSSYRDTGIWVPISFPP